MLDSDEQVVYQNLDIEGNELTLKSTLNTDPLTDAQFSNFNGFDVEDEAEGNSVVQYTENSSLGKLCGFISFGTSFIFYVYTNYPYSSISQALPSNMGYLYSLCTSATWLVSFLYLTNFSVFSDLSNGYLTLWVGCAASIWFLTQNVPFASTALSTIKTVYNQSNSNSKPIFILVLSSGIEFLAALAVKKHHFIAIMLGVGSFALSFAQIYFQYQSQSAPDASEALGFRLDRYFGKVIPIWWFVGVMLCTFSTTFVDKAGDVTSLNGYIGTWISFFASIWYYYLRYSQFVQNSTTI
eukprot:maker-scaffold_7-snap-gene-19.78-mRNA-1 protein AED:0.03 eAED:0.11 QI:0/0/0.5/1/1/1/2/1119/295